jgi:hypothetical protein
VVTVQDLAARDIANRTANDCNVAKIVAIADISVKTEKK